VFAWDDAVKEITGRDFQLASMRIPGMTDYQIAVRTLESLGLEPEHDLLERLVRRYESLLPSSLPRKNGYVLPNVREILEGLRERDDVRSYLLTGNTRGGAEAKLTYYGLWSFFPSGAFAQDSGARATIAVRAMELARRDGPVAEADAFVIGDTPHDIEGANAIGVRTIAVATGGYDVDELTAHKPWRLYSELPAPDEFVRLVESAPRDPAESPAV
jgi:phosphoglycolate phosphatase-like HAD superfamily hydrolase